jgi:ABC-type spermidine/putrescine transport system permease subunit II
MTTGTATAGVLRGSRFLPAYFIGLIILLYLPLAVLLLFSFNAGTSLSFPIQELTLHWYQRLFDSPEVLRAARNSIVVGVGSGTGATVLGTAVALLLTRFRFRGESFLFTLAMRSWSCFSPLVSIGRCGPSPSATRLWRCLSWC